MTFENSVLDHLPELRAYARSLLREREAADDLVEKSLAVAVRKHPQDLSEADLKIWLFKILHDVFVGAHSGKAAAGSDANARTEAEVSIQPQEDQDNEVQAQEMETTFHALPNAHKEALALVAMHGLSDREAAMVADVSVGTLRTRLYRARKALKHRLDFACQREVAGTL